MIAFGPVPSRRLGSSLGINHIPPKHCPYSCVYCQVGRTDHLEIVPRQFFTMDEIVQSVEHKVKDSLNQGQKIDFLTFVPDGEPTLDEHLGEAVEVLKFLGYPIAVISNAALIDQPEVRQALSKADWVSLKVDSVIEETWRQVNRPNRRLSLENIRSGMLAFSSQFSGELVTETMLVAGVNDSPDAILNLAEFLSELKPAKAYLSIPTRPPAEGWVSCPTGESLTRSVQILSGVIPTVELLSEEPEAPFISTGDLAGDILSISAVHPLKEEALREMVERAGADWAIVEELVASQKVKRISYLGSSYYLRNNAYTGNGSRQIPANL
jgi:wyosine [tRNA(Phe)-imidazoG37] synthetase (radical SAM superfamily)